MPKHRERFPILEFASSAGRKPTVNRETGEIFGVKFLGEVSLNPAPNNNYYPRSTREKSIRILEGRRIGLNHSTGKPGQARPYQEVIGVAKDLREGGDGLYGTARINPKHPNFEQIAWDVENAPQNVMFSINAHGRSSGKDAQGRVLIEEIFCDSNSSIDLVSQGATTSSISEAYQGEPVKKIILKKLLENLVGKFKAKLGDKAPKRVKLLEDMVADPGYEKGMAGEVEEPEPEMDSSEAGIQAACTMLESAMREGDWKKAMSVLKAFEKLLSEKEEEPSGGDDDAPPNKDAKDDADAEESLKTKGKAGLKKLTESFDLRIKARDLAADAGVTPNKVLRKALDACTTEAEVKELIEEARTVATIMKPGLGKPVSASPFLKTDNQRFQFGANGGATKPVKESATTAPAKPKLEEELAALRSKR